MVTYDDSPALIAQRRADLLDATRIRQTNRSGEQTWTPCPGTGQPTVGDPVESLTSDNRIMVAAWCGTCGRFGGARWTTGSSSKPLEYVVARKHLREQ